MDIPCITMGSFVWIRCVGRILIAISGDLGGVVFQIFGSNVSFWGCIINCINHRLVCIVSRGWQISIEEFKVSISVPPNRVTFLRYCKLIPFVPNCPQLGSKFPSHISSYPRFDLDNSNARKEISFFFCLPKCSSIDICIRYQVHLSRTSLPSNRRHLAFLVEHGHVSILLRLQFGDLGEED